jgi:nucleoside-diphosphate-sugar epimerase
VLALRNKLGTENVFGSDIKQPDSNSELLNGPFEILDVIDGARLKNIVEEHQITDVYLLAALLSATAEKSPMFAWKLNMEGLFNVLNLAKDKVIKKVFWPSSIAVFGPSSPKLNTPQVTVMEPTTVYGISKLAGERWCEYYHNKYGVDVRSIRYPGLISHKTEPGGGTTDYAVDVFHKAVSEKKYTCYLEADTYLPMMYMDDAIRATISLMETNSDNITVRSSYNISGISFSPNEIANSIKSIVPDFNIDYKVDSRQDIANSWPKSINDSVANKDWGWKNEFSLQEMTNVMLTNLQEKVSL